MKELPKRSLTGLAYVLVLLISLKSKIYFAVLIFIFGIISNIEFSKLVKQRRTSSYIIFSILYLFYTYFDYTLLNNSFFNESKNILLIVSIIVVIFLIRDLFVKRDLPKILSKNYISSTFYLSSSFIFIALIPNYLNKFNAGLVLGIFVLAWVNDSFAYIIGKNFGKQKLFPSISPKKTVEGFVGGVIFTCFASYAVGYFTETLSYENWLILSIIVSIFGTIGDLIESKFKREAMVKDSGVILPGHGGLLDRLDSIILAAPFIYLFLNILENVS